MLTYVQTLLLFLFNVCSHDSEALMLTMCRLFYFCSMSVNMFQRLSCSSSLCYCALFCIKSVHPLKACSH